MLYTKLVSDLLICQKFTKCGFVKLSDKMLMGMYAVCRFELSCFKVSFQPSKSEEPRIFSVGHRREDYHLVLRLCYKRLYRNPKHHIKVLVAFFFCLFVSVPKCICLLFCVVCLCLLRITLWQSL